MQGTLKIVIIAENHRVGIEGSGDSDFFFFLGTFTDLTA